MCRLSTYFPHICADVRIGKDMVLVQKLEFSDFLFMCSPGAIPQDNVCGEHVCICDVMLCDLHCVLSQLSGGHLLQHRQQGMYPVLRRQLPARGGPGTQNIVQLSDIVHSTVSNTL